MAAGFVEQWLKCSKVAGGVRRTERLGASEGKGSFEQWFEQIYFSDLPGGAVFLLFLSPPPDAQTAAPGASGVYNLLHINGIKSVLF